MKHFDNKTSGFHWISTSKRQPNNDDIVKNGSDMFWVALLNLDNEYEVTVCNWNNYLNLWEVRENEHVLYWNYFYTPEMPKKLRG